MIAPPRLDRLRPIARKEFRQIRRDPRSLVFLLGLPAFLLLLFGFALNFDVKRVPLAVFDLDGSPASRDLVAKFTATEHFRLKARGDDPRALDGLLAREEARVGLVIPRGYAEDLAAGREPAVQVVLDGANASSAATIAGYVGAIFQEYSVRLTTELLEKRGRRGIELPLDVRTRVWYNPELRSVKFLIPGLMAFILMVIVVVSTAFSVVREKERGTMEELRVSPVRASELIVGKTVPYIFISLLSAHLVLLLGYVLFGVGIRGHYLLLLLAMTLFLTGGLAQGVLISTATKTQQAAFMIAMLTTFLPTLILSGFIFPIRNMPVAIQAVSYLVPARYFLVALRTIMLKGAGLPAFWDQLLGLTVFAALMLALSMARLTRESDGRPRKKRFGR
jgi:ABC-2 type transport system permease protein